MAHVVVALLPVALALMIVAPVSAVDSGKIIQSNVCEPLNAPTITSTIPVEPLDAPSFTIEGTGQPDALIQLVNNGVAVGAGLVTADGVYAIMMPLAEGENRVTATVGNACESKSSAEVLILRTVSSPAGGDPTGRPDTGPDDEGTAAPTTPPVGGIPDVSTLPGDEPAPGEDIHEGDTEGGELEITSPPDGATTKDVKTLVTGVAPPGSVVSIYVNGHGVARVIADEEGTFGAVVPLDAGNNVIRARAATSDGKAYQDTIRAQSNPPGTGAITTVQAIILLIAVVVLAVVAVTVLWRYRTKTRRR